MTPLRLPEDSPQTRKRRLKSQFVISTGAKPLALSAVERGSGETCLRMGCVPQRVRTPGPRPPPTQPRQTHRFSRQVCVRRFDERIYSLGSSLIRKTLTVPPPSADLISAGPIIRREGKFSFIDDSTCLFTLGRSAFSLQAPHREFGLKATATRGPNGAEITGRLPLGPTRFIFFALTGLTAASVIIGLRKSVAMAIPFWLFGVGVCVVIALSHIKVERRSMDLMIAELRQILRA
jgi:hypothetical protein